MQNYDIIWLAWLASPAVSLVARMHFVVPFVCSLSVTTAVNSTNNAIPTILLMSWTSLAHYISHSPPAGTFYRVIRNSTRKEHPQGQ